MIGERQEFGLEIDVAGPPIGPTFTDSLPGFLEAKSASQRLPCPLIGTPLTS